jgi:hypothetical protein
MKIESGAKSTLDPNTERAIRPYVNDDSPDRDMSVANVTTVDPERLFWDRVVILHGLQRWYERPRELRGGGQRISRHNYDIYRLTDSDAGRRAIADKPSAWTAWLTFGCSSTDRTMAGRQPRALPSPWH